MFKKRLFIISIISALAVCLSFSGVIAYGEYKSYKKDIYNVKKVVLYATELEQRLPILPDMYSTSDSKVPDDVVNKHKDKILKELSAAFSSKSQIMTQRLGQMINAIDGQLQNDMRVEDGGVKLEKFKSVHINNNTAFVVAELTTWSKFTEYKPEKLTFNPRNTGEYTFTLVKEDGIWKVGGMTMKFLPGQGP